MNYSWLLLLLLLIAGCSKDRRSLRSGRKMQDFVVAISDYAKERRPGFIIIPQNGAELLFHNLDDQDDPDDRYINAIDGIGIEELFYNGMFAPDNYRLQMLLRVKNRIPVFVADYLTQESDYDTCVLYNTDAGFIPFPRSSANYDYKYIPAAVPNENTDDVLNASDARNYLYLIGQDGFSDKSAFLNAIRQTNFDLVIIDAFYGSGLFSNDEINSLKTKANGGKRLVIAYMSVGSAEKYHYYWKDEWKLHKPKWLKKEYDGYPDEVWVKFWKKDWQEIICGSSDSYTQKILDAGFDGAYLDNVEAFYFLYFDE